MKSKVAISLFCILFQFLNLAAQDHKWEADINLSIGGYGTEYEGNLFKAGVGASRYISDKVFLRLGVDYMIAGELGCDYDDWDYSNEEDYAFEFINIPITAHYKVRLTPETTCAFIFGIGPSLNFTTWSRKFKFYDDYSSYFSGYTVPYETYKQSLEGRNMVKGFNIGIQPSVFYQMGHLRLGVEGNIGLLDIGTKSAYKKDPFRIYELMLTASVYFKL